MKKIDIFIIENFTKPQKDYFVKLYLQKLNSIHKSRLSLKKRFLMLFYRKYIKKASKGKLKPLLEKSLKKREKLLKKTKDKLKRDLIKKSNKLDKIAINNHTLYMNIINLSKTIKSNIVILKQNSSFELAKDLIRIHLKFLNEKIKMEKITIEKGKIQSQMEKLLLKYNRSKKVSKEKITFDLLDDLISKTPALKKTGMNFGKNFYLETQPKIIRWALMTKEMIKNNTKKLKEEEKELLEIIFRASKYKPYSPPPTLTKSVTLSPS